MPPARCLARRLRQNSLADLIALVGHILRPPQEGSGRRRVFTPAQTFWLFLAQVISATRTCREALRKAQALFTAAGGRDLSPSTSAYCQARARLPLEYVEKALVGVTAWLAEHDAPWWCGRRVRVVDGSSLSMPDTPENQALYPQPSAQKPGCGFPIVRFVALFSLATGAWTALAKGALAQGERTLYRELWTHLRPGEVVLADRGFSSFAEFYLLLHRGVDCVTRLHGRRSAGVQMVERLGKGDRLVEWKKTGQQPKWMSKSEWQGLPERLRVRHVEVTVAFAGFRTQSLTVATTLLDPRVYPAEEIAQLYRRRWQIELFLRDIKTTMGMDVLRCKSPDLVHKELLMYQIAYNLVRALHHEALARHGGELSRLSLAGSLAAIRQWAPVLAAQRSRRKREALFRSFLHVLARDTVPLRPNRAEPRARKRRPKTYQLLCQPRQIFREIPHRNRYAKPLS